MKTKWQQKEQIQKLIRQINWRITTLQTLKGGTLTTNNKVLRSMLDEHPELRNEWDILQGRKNTLKRLCMEDYNISYNVKNKTMKTRLMIFKQSVSFRLDIMTKDKDIESHYFKTEKVSIDFQIYYRNNLNQ